MTLKKQYDGQNIITIGNEAVIYTRNGNWQFRMWIAKENKMFRESLCTKSKELAEQRAINLLVETKYRIQNGKTFFSITCKEAVAMYVEYRRNDIALETIVVGRLRTIETHLKNWLNYIGENTRLKDLDRNDCMAYFTFRNKSKKGGLSKTTLGNEQSTINAMIKWLHEEKEIELNYFKFQKLKENTFDNDRIKRQTFENEEYDRICVVMRDYCKRTNYISNKEWVERQIVRHWILIAANCGFRTGEQTQLRWSDVKIEKHIEKGEEHTLANISVRKETSKVRNNRTFIARGGQYFERLKEITKPKTKNGFVFSADGTQQTNKKIVYKHFKEIIGLAKIENYKQRGIVPYSLRHFCISQRIKSSCTYGEVAEMTGTSIKQIENVYLHLDRDAHLTTALKDYRRKNGVIELKSA